MTRLRQIRLRYADHAPWVLDDVSFSLDEGEALDGVSIHYMHPVIGSVATAKATRYGRSIIVNVRVDGEKKERARLTFTVA